MRLPSHLAKLLHATPATRESAWQDFVARYSRLILSVARSMGGGYDAIMDRYAYILERLARDDSRRLRAYVHDPRARFTTWLVVVCRRLALDERRARLGRVRKGTDVIRLRARRALADTVASSLDMDTLAAPGEPPDVTAERHEALERLQRSLRSLAPRDLLLVTLRFEHDLSAADIARALHMPTPFHVYRRLRSVLRGLRAGIEGGARESAQNRTAPSVKPLMTWER